MSNTLNMNRKDVQLILKELNIVPKKRLGQNFLINNATKDIIIKQAQISKNDIILEIGPGLGALTENLVKIAKKVYAVATHALLLQNAKYRILSAGADEIIGTDSIDNEVSKVSLAKVIAEKLKDKSSL